MRFPEFTGEWNCYRLGDLTDLFSVRNKDGKNYPMFSVTNDMGFVPQSEKFEDREMIGENINSYKVIQQGDFAYNPARINVGSIARYQEDYPCMISSLYVCFKPDEQLVNSDLLLHILKSPRLIDKYKLHGEGGVRIYLFYPNFAQIRIWLPKTNSEQIKMAKLLTLIDERISTQIRIIDKLKSLMQGLINELMDNPKWAKIYVGDFMEFYSTNSLSWEQLNYNDGQVRNLHYGLIHSGLTTLVDCQKTHLPYIQEDSLPKQYSICKDGDVAFADASEDTAEVGKVVELTNIDDKKIVCGLHTIHGRDVKGMTVKGFKGFAFNSKYFHDQLRRIAQGSKVYSINTDNLKSCYLCIPTITEQKKMVGLLHCLQDKIGVAKQELFLYESQKRFLLNNLFV